MTWRRANSPESVFGNREKPFHLMGLNRRYAEFLNNDELEDLRLVLKILLVASTLESSEMHVLLVGSAAASFEHVDIDLLVCTSPHEKRIDVVKQSLSQFSKHPFKFEDHRARGSVDSFASGLFISNKIFAMSDNYWNTFDISFVGVGCGEWNDVLGFHSRTSLSHSIIG